MDPNFTEIHIKDTETHVIAKKTLDDIVSRTAACAEVFAALHCGWGNARHRNHGRRPVYRDFWDRKGVETIFCEEVVRCPAFDYYMEEKLKEVFG